MLKILGTEEELFDFSNIVFRPLLKIIFRKITKKEVRKAIKALKNNKAAGIDRIFVELLKYGGETVVNWLTYLFNLIWEQEIVPENWTKGIVVKLPKKGDLSHTARTLKG